MKRDNAKKLLDAIGTAALVGFAGGVAKALAGLLITYVPAKQAGAVSLVELLPR
jgi:hypothetical protein